MSNWQAYRFLRAKARGSIFHGLTQDSGIFSMVGVNFKGKDNCQFEGKMDVLKKAILDWKLDLAYQNVDGRNIDAEIPEIISKKKTVISTCPHASVFG